MFGEIFFLYCAFVITVCGVLAISLRNPIDFVLLVALVAALTLARRQPVCTPAPAQAENKACPCASGNKDQGGAA